MLPDFTEISFSITRVLVSCCGLVWGWGVSVFPLPSFSLSVFYSVSSSFFLSFPPFPCSLFFPYLSTLRAFFLHSLSLNISLIRSFKYTLILFSFSFLLRLTPHLISYFFSFLLFSLDSQILQPLCVKTCLEHFNFPLILITYSSTTRSIDIHYVTLLPTLFLSSPHA